MNESDTISSGGRQRTLTGIPASAGIAIASATVHAGQPAPDDGDRRLSDAEIVEETERFRGAVRKADAMIGRTESLAQDDLMSQSAIFEALRMVLHDPALVDGIIENIGGRRMTARAAIMMQMGMLAEIFEASPDNTLQSRAEDVRALESHLLACLSDGGHAPHFNSHTILTLPSLSPLNVVEYARANVPGLVSETGGINSHAAILARSFGVPMVAGVTDACAVIPPDALVIVDGYKGHVIVLPDAGTLAAYRQKKEEMELRRTRIRAQRDLPAETLDGLRVTLAANIDAAEEIDVAIENGARKVGLLRTEFMAPYRLDQFGVEEQTEQYLRIAERAFPMTVAMRAFDVGGDKPFAVGDSSTGDDRSSDSPLGLRGVRFLLKHEAILRTQVEAMLRASTMKNLRLMIPMVSSSDEMRQVNRIIGQVRADLRRRSVQFDEHMGVGAMIETPAAALSTVAIARHSAFLSIGTNDLTQYTLAVDRADKSVAEYYDELHPAVLQMIHIAVVASERADVPITICGELAANPLATAVLIGLGLHRFSVSPAHLGELKQRIRKVDAAEARKLAREVLRTGTGAEARALLH